MGVLVCVEHKNVVVNKMPRKARLALKTLGHVVKSATGEVVLQVVGKEECQVCMGEFVRKHSPRNSCEDHLRDFYMKTDTRLLADPSFTLPSVVVPKSKCPVCLTGTPLE